MARSSPIPVEDDVRRQGRKTAFITNEQFRKMNTRDHPPVDWHTSVTLPLLDDDGYPWPLRRLRYAAAARGGHVEGASRDWIFTHPARSSFHLRFHDDGYVALWFPCSDFDVPVPHDLMWRPEQVWTPRDDGGPGTDLDAAILAVLNGGYWEIQTENDLGEWRTYEWDA